MKRKQEIKKQRFYAEKGNATNETAAYKIGGTYFEVTTFCGGSERLYDKIKKRIPTTKEQQAIFRSIHESTVEEAVLEHMQELKANKCQPTKAEQQGMFSGLIFCADCGSKLHFATCKSFEGHYHCAKYKSNTGGCTAHFIREEVLCAIVLKRIFAATAMFYEDTTALWN